MHSLNNCNPYLRVRRRTAAYRSQGNSVLQRVHNTTHHTLAMYVNVSYDNWAELLRTIQRAQNTAYNKTLEETPHCLCLTVELELPVDIILGVPSTLGSGTRLEYSHRTVEDLHLAYEFVRRN